MPHASRDKTATCNGPVPGSIQYAKCSQDADAASIRREIGDKVHHVDHAIHVLLTAGMSTPALRDIARAVDIEHVAGWWWYGFLFSPVSFGMFY